MKLNLKSEIIPWLLILISSVAAIYFYFNFPAVVATHWNFYGQADGFSGRGFGAFFLPILVIISYLFITLLPYLDPKKERYKEFLGAYLGFRTVLILLFVFLQFITGFYNLGYKLNIGIAVTWLIGLLMLYIGWLMPKIKSNWFVGIRTPWTLSSDNVWNKTHALGRWLFVIFGLDIILMPYLPETWAITAFILGLMVLLLGSFGYSYWLYCQEKKI
ncbi:MAG: SdpI family protein [Candidatus Buchananbacteria bacterium]